MNVFGLEISVILEFLALPFHAWPMLVSFFNDIMVLYFARNLDMTLSFWRLSWASFLRYFIFLPPTSMVYNVCTFDSPYVFDFASFLRLEAVRYMLRYQM